ncbi:MAG: zinc ribbon domain-containing protein [Anaerolineae bacterium]|nr:zinc ribbon domain-containing protein [Anaerolineae bacterium]
MAVQGGQSQARMMSDLIRCPKCGHDNPVGTRYCQNCGASLTGVALKEEAKAPEKRRESFFSKLFGRRA